MILRRLRPLLAWGRWSPGETTRFGAALGSVGYIAVGPVAVLFSLPAALRKADPVVSLFDLNAHLRELAEASARSREN